MLMFEMLIAPVGPPQVGPQPWRGPLLVQRPSTVLAIPLRLRSSATTSWRTEPDSTRLTLVGLFCVEIGFVLWSFHHLSPRSTQRQSRR